VAESSEALHGGICLANKGSTKLVQAFVFLAFSKFPNASWQITFSRKAQTVNLPVQPDISPITITHGIWL
jgi:hypothetical protein